MILYFLYDLLINVITDLWMMLLYWICIPINGYMNDSDDIF